tara:strand:+ start:218 stop:841 length:624 start_codon:yes stop_codon:yes gene_type:complete
MLLANNLSINRSNRTLFKNLDFSAQPKSITQIRGRNGIGKTTLIKILSGIISPDVGDVYWNGKNISKNSKDFFNNLSLVMDSNTSKNDLTVYENIKFWKSLFFSSITKNETDSLLEMLNLDKYKNSFVRNLSSGEKRKLEISRLVIESKKVWIFDEPYIGLDETTINIFNETIRNHTKNDGIVIFSSHYHLEILGVNTIDLEKYANN